MAEEYKIVGTITGKEHQKVGRLFLRQQVTLYTISGEDGTTYNGCLKGHFETPDLGDKVEMYLKKDSIAMKSMYDQHRTGNGSIEITDETIQWNKIKKYKLLKRRENKG